MAIQRRLRRFLQANPERSGASELPGDAIAAHHAHHLPADLALDHRPPRDQAEAEPVTDRGKAATAELHGAKQFTAHCLAIINRDEGKTGLSGELAAGPLHFLALKGSDEVGVRTPFALGGSPCMALPDKIVGAPVEGVADPGAESTLGERALVAAGRPTVEPSRAVARHLPVEIVAGQDPHTGLTAPARIVGRRASLKILGNDPADGAGPLDNAGAAQRLRAPHVGIDECVIVSTTDAGRRSLQDLSVNARAILARAMGDDRDVAVRRT